MRNLNRWFSAEPRTIGQFADVLWREIYSKL